MRITKDSVLETLALTFGIFITAVSIHFFMEPSHLIVGTIAGFSLLLSTVTGLPLSLLTFIVNALLLVLGCFICGREFGLKTIYTSLMLSPLLLILEFFFPVQASLTGDTAIDLLCFVLLLGLSQAILFQLNASSGGLDIVAKILNKLFHMELSTGILLSGIVISISAIFVYDLSTVIVGLLGTYLDSLVIDHFLLGFTTKKRVCIISDEYEDLERFIMINLHRGATRYQTVGCYENKPETEIESIMTRQELVALLDHVADHNIKAFITVSNCSEIYGVWFQNRGRKIPK